MADSPPSVCFVVFPPLAKNNQILFGKNSARPRDEVQEILYVPASDHEPGSKVQCTYLEVDQVQRTHAVLLTKPVWMWGGEMGANEHGVCIGNVAVTTKQEASDSKLLLGMDLVRLGLERGKTAKESVDIIVSLLEEHGQGGNYFEGDGISQTFHSAFLIVDRVEAWVLETAGKFWAAERITDGVKCICDHFSIKTQIDLEHPELRSHAKNQGWWNEDKEFSFSDVFSEDSGRDCSRKKTIENQEAMMSVETMFSVLRDKSSGVCVDSGPFITTASAVSVIPQNGSSPCIHFVTGTPDPSRSVFKPFIFVEDVKPVNKAQSCCLGGEPCGHGHSQRSHELYKRHQCALSLIENDQAQGEKLLSIMQDLEKQGLEAMEDILKGSSPLDPAEIVDLFYDCVDTEIKFYK
ncbi:secernin-1 isoform X1 [Spea bombifrons]|uniref:secernin-1 isoform X1 n=1 Tax=Spea bombifrons TaxID=233779 RepID=UPI0023490897|nr:secernin-1 isoform X1 [Spea bombifrons]